MKLLRVLARLALLLVAAAAFVGLTEFYGGSVQPPLPEPVFQEEHRHPASAPHVWEFPDFVATGLGLALFAVGGRIVLRLRLNPASRNEERVIRLDLGRTQLRALGRESPAKADL